MSCIASGNVTRLESDNHAVFLLTLAAHSHANNCDTTTCVNHIPVSYYTLHAAFRVILKHIELNAAWCDCSPR